MKCRHAQSLHLQSFVRNNGKPHIHYANGGTIIASEGEILDAVKTYDLRDLVVPNSSKLQHSELSNCALAPMKFRKLFQNKVTLKDKTTQLYSIKPCYTKESRYAE